MILTDAGPLFALVDRSQASHELCVSTVRRMTKPMVTPWPCFTEAMYFTFKAGGWVGQRLLWNLVENGTLRLHAPAEQEVERMKRLMAKYWDTPMDLADASLVAAAEALGERRIFTLDSDFRVYRLNDTRPFEVVP